uniref:Uncharacterized protein n=1 Tax=Glossina pallidipes TaxID=7398 RepID=A0A1A9ZK32_GLOPL
MADDLVVMLFIVTKTSLCLVLNIWRDNGLRGHIKCVLMTTSKTTTKKETKNLIVETEEAAKKSKRPSRYLLGQFMSSSWDPTKIEVTNFWTLCIESQREACLDWHISELTQL